MKRLLVTGGTGYLGAAVAHQAHQAGWQVAATYHSQQPPEEPTVTWLLLDVRQAQDIDVVFDRVQPDIVIHTAFRQHEPDMWDVTALGSYHVAAAAQTYGARLIHLSSDVIFDGETSIPYTEYAVPNPITPYGAAKADAEHFVSSVHTNVALVRTSLIYGFNPPDRHTRFILNIADGHDSAQLFCDEWRCPIFVKDLSDALLELACHNYRGIINVAGSEMVSRYTFGSLLAAHHGRNPERIASGLSTNQPVRRPRNCTLNVRLAQSMLTTPLRGLQEVLQDQQEC